MTRHPWLPPAAPLAQKVARARATVALRHLASIPPARLGRHAAAWQRLLAALPAMLRSDRSHVLDAVSRLDVLPVLFELADTGADADRLERALLTLWIGLAGHPALTSPLALPGPFTENVVDPTMPRLIALGNVRGLLVTAQGPVVAGRGGRQALEAFATAVLPHVDRTVIVTQQLGVPDPAVVERVRAALQLVQPALPGGRLERVTIGVGNAEHGEARVGPDVDAADLIASAQAAFIRAAASVEPILSAIGTLVEGGRRLKPVDLLARLCGNIVALPWRTEQSTSTRQIVDDRNDLAVIADPTPAGTELLSALHPQVGDVSSVTPRALLVNVDPHDFIYSFQFGQSVERRCVERGWRVDRIATDPSPARDLAAELGQPTPPPVADGTELIVGSQEDPLVSEALRRLAKRRYMTVVGNVRSQLFYDLLTVGLLESPTLLWDRHLHDGLAEESARRSEVATCVRSLQIQVWSLLSGSGYGWDDARLIKAGIEKIFRRHWPIDLDFFRSNATHQSNRLFAGGDSKRDWPLLVHAIEGLPLDVHLVTRHAPAGLPPHVRVDARLPLWKFRDALAAASITAIPLVAGGTASGVTVLPMAMALGVAIVATASPWVTHYATDGEDALLVPPDDVAAFRAALVRLIEDDALRARLVSNARRRVAVSCDLDALTREMFATLGAA
ncbi:MAG: glycosyltransferase [Candidatus Binatia bacterium]